MDANTLVGFVGAIGIGGMIISGVQLWNENRNKRKQRLFDEKKMAYLEYMNAIQKSQFMPEKEGRWLREVAMGRLELFANQNVLEQLEVGRSLHNADLTIFLKELFKRMRQDLDSYY